MEKGSRSRSKAACQFCRVRKLKCDNLQPECSACKVRQIPCEYVVRQPVPRPSNAAIQALQAENDRLRRLLSPNSSDLGVVEPGGRTDAEIEADVGSSIAPPPDQLTATAGSQTSNPAKRRRVVIDENAASTIEGLNSTPFIATQFQPETDLTTFNKFNLGIHKVDLSQQTPKRKPEEPRSPLDSQTKDVLRSQLVAAAARQRTIIRSSNIDPG